MSNLYELQDLFERTADAEGQRKNMFDEEVEAIIARFEEEYSSPHYPSRLKFQAPSEFDPAHLKTGRLSKHLPFVFHAEASFSNGLAADIEGEFVLLMGKDDKFKLYFNDREFKKKAGTTRFSGIFDGYGKVDIFVHAWLKKKIKREAEHLQRQREDV